MSTPIESTYRKRTTEEAREALDTLYGFADAPAVAGVSVSRAANLILSDVIAERDELRAQLDALRARGAAAREALTQAREALTDAVYDVLIAVERVVRDEEPR